MDIRALMNDAGDGPSKSSTQPPPRAPSYPAAPPLGRPPPARSFSGPQRDTPPSLQQSYGGPPSQVHHQQQQQHHRQPQYQQPPYLDTDTRQSSYSTNSSANVHTPIHTPQQQGPHAAYPFPPQQFQSPVMTHEQRPNERWPTPGGRAASHSYMPSTQPQPSPTSRHQQPPPLSASLHRPSGTPPGPPSLSPKAYRQSPQTQGQPLPPNYYNQSHQSSQPSTPFAPPPVAPPHGMAMLMTPNGAQSHPRRMSGSVSARSQNLSSPGPAYPGIGRASESPAAYTGTPLPAAPRPPSENLGHEERTMSPNVSPKTQPTRIHISKDHGRQSMDSWSARSSVTQEQYGHEQRSSVSEQNIRIPGPPRVASRPPSGHHLHQGLPSPLSKTQNQDQHAHANPDVRSEYRDSIPPSSRQVSLENPSFTHPDPPQDRSSQEPLKPHLQVIDRPSHAMSVGSDSSLLLQQPTQTLVDEPPPRVKQDTNPHKRRADDVPDVQQEHQKKPRTQYSEPPMWARLHPSNPDYHDQINRYPQLLDKRPRKSEKLATTNVPAGTARQNVQPSNPSPALASTSAPAPNGVGPSAETSGLEARTAKISRLLGSKWESSIKNQAPSDPLLHNVATFLYLEMLKRPQLGAGDPRNGSLEIEAKIGTLIDRNTEDRLALPAVTPCVINEQFSKDRIRFESFMNEHQHKTLNMTLNDFLRASFAPDRVQMQYLHTFERDSFATLNASGIAALPGCAHPELERLAHEGPRRPQTVSLRTTTSDPDATAAARGGGPQPDDSASPEVLARIVKLRLADLDIYCPADQFDVRISVNIEISLLGRPDISDFRGLVVTDAAAEGAARRPDRKKDRLSYRHLAYAVDLTQVTYDDGSGKEGEQPRRTHELEVEIDAALLRAQAERLKTGTENCYEELVEGWLNDVLLLVRA